MVVMRSDEKMNLEVMYLLDRFKELPQAVWRRVLAEDVLAPASGHPGTVGQSCETQGPCSNNSAV